MAVLVEGQFVEFFLTPQTVGGGEIISLPPIELLEFVVTVRCATLPHLPTLVITGVSIVIVGDGYGQCFYGASAVFLLAPF